MPIERHFVYLQNFIFVRQVFVTNYVREDLWKHERANFGVQHKIISEKRGKHPQNRGKPYDAPAGKGKQRVAHGQRTSGGDAPAGVICFKCGKPGHKSNVCTAKVKRCHHCGKNEHIVSECKHKNVVCFKCKEEGHIGSKCPKPKRAQSSGKIGRARVGKECRSRWSPYH